jgi:hypothetical protein
MDVAFVRVRLTKTKTVAAHPGIDDSPMKRYTYSISTAI